MNYDSYFIRNEIVNVDAAVVGIGAERWVGIPESEASAERAQEVMRENRFDVLPVKRRSASVRDYFRTEFWNDFSAVKRCTMEYQDVLPFNTSVRDVIRGFAEQNRHFFFLSGETGIVGLVSVANLGCRQVRVFLYSLVSELEVRLAGVIEASISEEDVIKNYFKEDHLGRWEQERNDGVDASATEYLYLSDLINIIAKERLFGRLGYPSRKKFEKDFNRLNPLRQDVAHPVRSLIKSKDSVKKLWTKMQFIESTLFRLRIGQAEG